MKIIGYMTYFAHKWVDKVYLRKNKNCEHPYFCEGQKKLLAARKRDWPFVEMSIQDPQLIDEKLI